MPRTPATEARLKEFYREVHGFAARRDRGGEGLRRRRFVPEALDAKILILGQGPAKSTQRVTGFFYRKVTGLSDAGRRLDDFLRALDHTIDHTDRTRSYVYSTDLVPWFPGKRGKCDVAPAHAEVLACWRFFEEEVSMVRPRVIVVLGRAAARLFLGRYAGERISRLDPPLIELAGRVFAADVAGHHVNAVVVWHPAAAWGRFKTVAQATYADAERVIAPLLSEAAPEAGR